MNLSQFINKLEQKDQIITVSVSVDVDLEVAELTDRQCKSVGGGKALLFTNNGTKFPLATNIMGSMERLHEAFGVSDLSEIEERLDKIFGDVTSPKRSLFEKLALLPTLKQVASFMPKHLSKRGACQEFEIEPDLSLLPVLKCAPHDGGKFITLPLVHTVDPQSGQQNVGMYRMQLLQSLENEVDTALQSDFKSSQTEKSAPVLKSACALSEPHFEAIGNGVDTALHVDFKSSQTEKSAPALISSQTNSSHPAANGATGKINTTGMHWHKHKTGANHYQKYKELGQKMPVVVCLGGDPLYTYCATAPMPEGIDEYILAGFLRKKAVRLVKCATCDIEVPEDVDFVIEGYVDPSEELVVEGDFGDHTGFYSLKDLYPKFHVTKITHKKDAIYPATIVGVPPMEDFYFALASERIFLKPIQMVIAPEVADIWMPMEGVAHNLVVAMINKRYDGQAFKVASALWGAGQMSFNKVCVICGNDKPQLSPIERVLEGLRSVDFKRDCTFVNGVLDVLDHSSEKCGFGGKLCVDLTNVSEKPREKFKYIVAHEIGESQGEDALLVVDKNVPTDSPMGLVVWMVAANCDPVRDIKIDGNRIIIDGRAKVDVLERHPNVVCSSIETIELVDRRWSEYNIGEFIDSPSRKLIPLTFSDKATI